jgi:hypothetical protein
MIFADLLPGESVFLDTNVLVYHFAAHASFGAACTQLLQRVENQELLVHFHSCAGRGNAPADDH